MAEMFLILVVFPSTLSSILPHLMSSVPMWTPPSRPFPQYTYDVDFPFSEIPVPTSAFLVILCFFGSMDCNMVILYFMTNTHY